MRMFCWGKKEIVAMVFGSLCLFELFVGCIGMCMMGWWMVFVRVETDKILVVVVGSMRYAISFVIVCVTCISFVFLCLWVSNFVGLRVECKFVVGFIRHLMMMFVDASQLNVGVQTKI